MNKSARLILQSVVGRTDVAGQTRWSRRLGVALLIGCVVAGIAPAQERSVVVDTAQDRCYDDQAEIRCPEPGEPFYGQDAQYSGVAPAYRGNGDGTVTDLNTGLIWQQAPDLETKSTYAEALAGARTLDLAGYDDWRLPTIKELYSLIGFNGSGRTLTPYIDTTYFDFRFGDPSRGERVIDGQYWSSTEYVGTTYGGDATVFGVNFADGRIKGYPRDKAGPTGQPRANFFVRYVRGNPDYGVNQLVDNGDGTVTDLATALMWQKADDGATRDWEGALAYCENLSLAGHDDWRLPNAKELQGIVDYRRAPDASNRARRGPAIDPIFEITDTESWFWTSTTLLEAPPFLGIGAHAAYVTFGQAFGVINGSLINVHGAGAQRSDPKSGDPAEWANGFGPQGDEIRIYNYARCVRTGSGGSVALKRPNRLRAEPRPSGRIRLTWKDRSSGETGFEIQVRSSGEPWRTLSTVGANVARSVIGHLSPESAYRFRVRAVTAAAFSDWSNVAHAVA